MSMIPTISTKAAGGNISATTAVAIAAVAGDIIALDLQWNPRITKAREIIIPTAESWMLTDLYYASDLAAADPTNPVIEVKKDNDRLLDTSNQALSIKVDSNQRPNGLHGNLVFEGGSHMTMNAILNVDNVTTIKNLNATLPYEKQG